MGNPIVSIIIPVYKASDTIVKCARSLFGQTMTEGIEYIFIDDCSPDDSVARLEGVMKEYSKLSGQVRIVRNPQNLGVSETRKKGIRDAQGEYVAWVDSDDWIEPDMIESMWRTTRQGAVDVVVQNVFMDHYMEGELKETKEWKLYNGNNPKWALMHYHTDKYVPWGLPFQMSRRSMILEASKLVHNVNITEDAMMLIYLFARAKSCAWLEKAYYHYVSIEKSESLTHGNFCTKEEWERQQKNVDSVTEYLLKLDSSSYRVTANYIKWFWKDKFRAVFDDSWSFWKKYKECYRDAVTFDRTGIDTILHKIKIWLKYNFYPIYWYKEGRSLFSKK